VRIGGSAAVKILLRLVWESPPFRKLRERMGHPAHAQRQGGTSGAKAGLFYLHLNRSGKPLRHPMALSSNSPARTSAAKAGEFYEGPNRSGKPLRHPKAVCSAPQKRNRNLEDSGQTERSRFFILRFQTGTWWRFFCFGWSSAFGAALQSQVISGFIR
jgi:hypothetical protein